VFAAIAGELAERGVSILWAHTAVLGDIPPACVIEIVAAAPPASDIDAALSAIETRASAEDWFEFTSEHLQLPLHGHDDAQRP
jgi:hypothetical protein